MFKESEAMFGESIYRLNHISITILTGQMFLIFVSSNQVRNYIMHKSTEVSGLSVLIFRIFLSGIFITAGITHLIKPDQIAIRIESAAYQFFASFIGDPHLLGLLAGYTLLIGGIAFLLGIFTRWSALTLFLVLIPITITIQLGNGLFHGPLWKNVALFGGLIFFIINNPKVYSIYNK